MINLDHRISPLPTTVLLNISASTKTGTLYYMIWALFFLQLDERGRKGEISLGMICELIFNLVQFFFFLH